MHDNKAHYVTLNNSRIQTKNTPTPDRATTLLSFMSLVSLEQLTWLSDPGYINRFVMLSPYESSD